MKPDYVELIEKNQRLTKSMQHEELHCLISKIIRENFEGCDMLLTLFIAALNSPRSDRCLRPFPSCFVKDDVKDVAFLRQLCDIIPPLHEFLVKPTIISTEMLQLFAWLFVEKSFPLLEMIPFDTKLLPSTIPETCKPQYMFRIRNNSSLNETFDKRKGNNEIIFAYHGSQIDNFYSILKVGLQQYFSIEKETLYGKGIYLSSEFYISAHYSPYGHTWKNSSLGSKHSVIAVCEIIDDSERVKYKDFLNKKSSLNEGSIDEIPDKYFVVTDSDFVRLKYLLVYNKRKLPQAKSFLRQNIFWVILGLYFCMLMLIGYNGNPWKKYIKYLIDT